MQFYVLKTSDKIFLIMILFINIQFLCIDLYIKINCPMYERNFLKNPPEKSAHLYK